METDELLVKMGCSGRFTKLLDTLSIKDTCITKCYKGNPTILRTPDSDYRCAVPGSCIGMTLRAELILYMLYHADIITERQYQVYTGP